MLEKNFFGYEKQVALLESLASQQKLPHAVLLSGPDGNGLPKAALHIAAALLCQQPVDGSPCGNCQQCRQTFGLAHPDVFWLFPITKSKDIQHARDAMRVFRDFFFTNPYPTLKNWTTQLDAENKQLQMGVEDAKALISHLSLTAMSGNWKVVIIWAMEKMNTESSNKILKLLEEPDPRTKFICISHNPSELLPTILSRLQNFYFPVLEKENVLKHLQHLQPETDPAILENAAANAEGIVAQALEWLNCSENEFLEHFRSGMRTALKFHPDPAAEWVEKTARFPREKQKQFLEYALQLVRKCMLMHLGAEHLCSVLPGEKEFLSKFYAYVPTEAVPYWQELLDEAITHVERNANAKILFMDLLFKFNELLHLKKLA